LWYQFRVRRPGESFQMLRDFGPNPVLTWTTLSEGRYEMQVWARDPATGQAQAAIDVFDITPRVAPGGAPVVVPTAHPLVFLYSAAPCGLNASVFIRFTSAEGKSRVTPIQRCSAADSVNIYLAALQPSMQYTAQQVVFNGSTRTLGPAVSFTTGAVDIPVPPLSVTQTSTPSQTEGILLQSTLFGAKQIATDLAGNLLWYYPGNLSLLTRPAPNGHFLGILQSPGGALTDQRVIEFDLTGMTVLETNAARVNEQLAALGKRRISSFHHEARRISYGRTVVLATVEQTLTDVQGPGPVNIVGDMVIVFDQNLDVVWTWDGFDHLDPALPAVLGETCAIGSCPPRQTSGPANDWTHANSVQETADGQLLLSVRHLDWVLKLDYDYDAGSGDILWRLGPHGDFTIDSSDPFPWFSHQHDPALSSKGVFSTFDNGNTRVARFPGSHSRGQVLQLDETNMTARVIQSTDLGVFSAALGSANRLLNGNYHFTAGFLPASDGSYTTQSMEINRTGQFVYLQKAAAAEYRSFRLADLYHGE